MGCAKVPSKEIPSTKPLKVISTNMSAAMADSKKLLSDKTKTNHYKTCELLVYYLVQVAMEDGHSSTCGPETENVDIDAELAEVKKLVIECKKNRL